MIITLDTTTKKLTAKLSAAATTTEPTFQVSYYDSSTDVAELSNDGAFNSTTDIDLVTAPSSSTKRIIKDFVIFNGDTATTTVIIQFDNNGTKRTLFQVELLPNRSFILSQYLQTINAKFLCDLVDIGRTITITADDIVIGDGGKLIICNSTVTQTLTIKEGVFTAGDIITFVQYDSGIFKFAVENASTQSILTSNVKSYGVGSTLQALYVKDDTGKEIWNIIGGVS